MGEIVGGFGTGWTFRGLWLGKGMGKWGLIGEGKGVRVGGRGDWERV